MLEEHLRARAVVSGYAYLERQILECMEYIPYEGLNANAPSPRFAPLILEACGLVESIFKQLTAGATGRASFKKYSTLVEPLLDLEEAVSLLLLTPIEMMNPFGGWQKVTPAWWRSYNALKHDRLDSRSEANLGNALLSLAALHQVIARCDFFTPMLVSEGWVDPDNQQLPELIVGIASGFGVPITTLPVETRLLVSPLHSSLAEVVDGERRIINDADFSPRVRACIALQEVHFGWE